MKPLISLVMVSFNTAELTCLALHAAEVALQGICHEIIVIDNASHDNSPRQIRTACPQARLIVSDSNLGFAAANNLGMHHARGEFIVLLNSDAFVDQHCFQHALRHMRQWPQVALAGGKLLGRDGSLQPSARRFPRLMYDFFILSGLSARFPQSRLFGQPDQTCESADAALRPDWVPGAFAIIRRKALQDVGLFDERFFLYFEEVDLCRRLKQAGWQIAYWPDIRVIHLGGESSRTVTRLTLSDSGQQLTLWRMRSALLYYRKHHGLLAAGASNLLEYGWHGLRLLRNLLRGGEPARDRIRHARQQLQLLSQAWRDTAGGQISPPRPW